MHIARFYLYYVQAPTGRRVGQLGYCIADCGQVELTICRGVECQPVLFFVADCIRHWDRGEGQPLAKTCRSRIPRSISGRFRVNEQFVDDEGA